ncbi:MAG: OmpH family outer membrane protein [Candidatus Symbiothrix sp.]|jgi:outer membrane protein|nr:OmpH family outer membrane protein [Candidatus Symbiothrix sp.]
MLKKIVLVALFALPVSVFAQEKIAYFNAPEVITALPEYKQLTDSLQNTQKQIQAELQILEEEYQKKYKAFMDEGDKLIESIKIRRMQEIKDIEERAGLFNEQSQQRLVETRDNLLKPIQEKVRTALQAVATENNFTYVLDVNALVYVSPSAVDAVPLVKKKLGI